MSEISEEEIQRRLHMLARHVPTEADAKALGALVLAARGAVAVMSTVKATTPWILGAIALWMSAREMALDLMATLWGPPPPNGGGG